MNKPEAERSARARGKELRAYEPPAIMSREKLEVIAAVCTTGKADVLDPACLAGPIQS